MILSPSILERLKRKYREARLRGFGEVKTVVWLTMKATGASKRTVWNWIRMCKEKPRF